MPSNWTFSVGVALHEPAASSSRTSGAPGQLSVIPASPVCQRSCSLAVVRGAHHTTRHPYATSASVPVLSLRAASWPRPCLRITSVFSCVARRFKPRASLRFTGCCWWRLLAVDSGSGTSEGHALSAPVMRSPGARGPGIVAWYVHDLLIRSNGRTVQNRPVVTACLGDIPGLSSRVGSWLSPGRQIWQQLPPPPAAGVRPPPRRGQARAAGV
jgi:hypothetical protein